MHILIIGFGVVGKGVFAGLQRHFTQVEGTIIDQDAQTIGDGRAALSEQGSNPANHWDFQQLRIHSGNYAEVLSLLTRPGSLVVETCVEVNTTDILRWCLGNGRHFTNTVCDLWREQTLKKTDHYRNLHGILHQFVAPVADYIRTEITPTDPAQTTCLVGNGANIGMVNHYFKKALADAAHAWNLTPETLAASLSGVYIFEKDTIVFRRDFVPAPGIFYNTWNILEFHLESVAHVDYPRETQAAEHTDRPRDQAVSNDWYHRAMARDLRLRNHVVHGRLVAHEETYTIADYLLREYQRHPEVQFIYECSPIGEMSRIKIPLGSPCARVCVSDEADSAHGSDLVGTLIVLKDGRAWSTGFDCTQIELAEEIKAFSNATAWYVSSGILASILFMREFPSLGAGFPEDFDIRYNEIVIRNFESFVTGRGRKQVVSCDETGVASLSEPYPTYECENNYAKEPAHSPAVPVRSDIVTAEACRQAF
ncbi:hypothetical protein LBMAG53_08250 [Planctomycetota bacterium]|nr:hypothetical protein LBMAG53_08250 [Planctomycetota bacterium]